MPPHRSPRRDHAVSDIIGEVLMTAVVVVLISAAGVSLLSRPPPEDLVHADLQVENRSSLRIVHVGGERFDIDDADLTLEVNGTTERHALTEYAPSFADGSPDHWEPTERLCVSCQFPPGSVIRSMSVVTERQTIVEWIGRFNEPTRRRRRGRGPPAPPRGLPTRTASRPGPPIGGRTRPPGPPRAVGSTARPVTRPPSTGGPPDA